MRKLILAAFLASVAGVSFSQTTGAYGGLSLGGRALEADWTTTAVAGFAVDPTTNTASYNSTAARVGGFLGHNWQVAPEWIAGIEIDLAYADNKKTNAGIPGTHGAVIGSPTADALANDSTSVRATWDGSLRGRIGALVNPAALLYLTGGVAWQNVEVNAACSGVAGWCIMARSQTNTATRSGWTLGGGVEGTIAKNWQVRAEYRYADFGSKSVTFFPGTVDAVTADIKIRTHTAIVGLVFSFK